MMLILFVLSYLGFGKRVLSLNEEMSEGGPGRILAIKFKHAIASFLFLLAN
jgi:hypothetical protein